MGTLRFFLVAVFLFVSPASWAAVLSWATPVVRPAQITVASLSFASEGQPVSGIQFDLEWDANLNIETTAGSLIVASSKVFYSSALTNRSQRFMIIGLNGVAISDGELLRCFLATFPGLNLGTAQIRLTNVVATSPAGDSVPIRSSSADISIGNALSTAVLPPEAILNAASLTSGPICPGEVITILGMPEDASSSFVLINGAPAPILYAGMAQVNAIVPFGLDLTQPASIEIQSQGRSLGKGSVPVTPVAPAIFTQSGNGTGAGSVLNQDYSVNSYDTPAPVGSIIMIYGTGFGNLTPAAVDGQIAAGAASTTLPVAAYINGTPAEVTYAGAAPSLIAGVMQVNVRVPQSLPSNPAANIFLSIGGVTTGAGITVAIR